MTPNQLAAKLAGNEHAERVGKAFVRPLLRRTFPRDASAKGSSWNLTDEQRAYVTACWNARQKGNAVPDLATFRKSRRAAKAKPATVET